MAETRPKLRPSWMLFLRTPHLHFPPFLIRYKNDEELGNILFDSDSLTQNAKSWYPTTKFSDIRKSHSRTSLNTKLIQEFITRLLRYRVFDLNQKNYKRRFSFVWQNFVVCRDEFFEISTKFAKSYSSASFRQNEPQKQVCLAETVLAIEACINYALSSVKYNCSCAESKTLMSHVYGPCRFFLSHEAHCDER